MKIELWPVDKPQPYARKVRRCYAMEIDPVYCDVIVARWEAATGKKAVLAEGGLLFDQLREQRLGVVA